MIALNLQQLIFQKPIIWYLYNLSAFFEFLKIRKYLEQRNFFVEWHQLISYFEKFRRKLFSRVAFPGHFTAIDYIWI